ncbi:MAG TPA: hypothetical protein VFW68_12865 [Rhodocyclaceae bacterium]|nr:hypothetical protein [Rhodocyclaceae bacterium]
MTRRKSPARSSIDSNLRRAIASHAARLMAEDGINDYGYAKRKAARALGIGEGEALPTNEEVQVELRAYQSLYQEDELQERLQEMRATALQVMENLAEFRPYLTGAVLDGTAVSTSAVEIDLFADSAKDVEIALLSQQIPYRTSEPRRRGPDTPETLLHIEWRDIPVTLAVYPLQLERVRPTGNHDRAKASAVAALLETQP